MILARMRTSLNHRPWNVDVLSGLTVAAFGAFMFGRPAAIETKQAWDFLDPLNLCALSVVLMVLGTAQFGAALFNVFWLRWLTAFLSFWNWSSFAWGLHHYDPDASMIVLVVMAAVANALILVRLY